MRSTCKLPKPQFTGTGIPRTRPRSDPTGTGSPNATDEDTLARRAAAGDDDAREQLADERRRIRGDDFRARFREEHEALKEALGNVPPDER